MPLGVVAIVALFVFCPSSAPPERRAAAQASTPSVAVPVVPRLQAGRARRCDRRAR